MKDENFMTKVLIPVLSLAIALSSVLSTFYIQKEQSQTSIKTTEFQVKYNEKRKAYAKFLSIASKSYHEVNTGKVDQIQENIAELYYQFYMLEPLFEDDFKYVFRELMSSSNVPDGFHRNTYFVKSNIPDKYRYKKYAIGSYPLGSLVINLNYFLNDPSSDKKENKDEYKEVVGKNLEDLINFFENEVFYKLFIEGNNA